MIVFIVEKFDKPLDLISYWEINQKSLLGSLLSSVNNRFNSYKIDLNLQYEKEAIENASGKSVGDKTRLIKSSRAFLVLFGGIIILGQGSAIAPFIYTIF